MKGYKQQAYACINNNVRKAMGRLWGGYRKAIERLWEDYVWKGYEYRKVMERL